MKYVLDLLKQQLPSTKLHGLGTTAFVIALALLGYYEYVGDGESAEKVLMALLTLLVPAPLHPRADEPAEAPTTEEPTP